MLFKNKINLHYDASKKNLLLSYNEELRKWKTNAWYLKKARFKNNSQE
ncbi:MAG: hypothetical protein I3270_00465 [Candidatus Moeniiplasma glomeromycotorum]|nr:hypothetical protein [Candidatus Moeniiplasma glomeromycotorum]MCE8162234.1 hypothetical protein [Candidatus Moeniiplasma glomeromycotorum]MCE8166110.1 hypothetical protein [Candidatus Moeniiplasma glomeromycotorum]MCE8166633.1 hypothetical protein [Candidatus Moeniiplasma glomeromycotorum]